MSISNLMLMHAELTEIPGWSRVAGEGEQGWESLSKFDNLWHCRNGRETDPKKGEREL